MVKVNPGVDPNRSSSAPVPDEIASVQALPTRTSAPESLLSPTERRFPLSDENHHILENILNLKQDSEVHEAFFHSGIDHPNDLATVNLLTGPTALLTYKEIDTNTLKYASRHYTNVHKLIAYVHWTQDQKNASDNYGTITSADFDTFRDDGRLKTMSQDALMRKGTYTNPAPPGPSTQSTPFVGDRTKNFNKGIKRDARAYKTISDDKHFMCVHDRPRNNTRNPESRPTMKNPVKVVLLETVLPARELTMGSDSASVTVTHNQGDENVQSSVIDKTQGDAPVSYTHLTLPTICSV